MNRSFRIIALLISLTLFFPVSASGEDYAKLETIVTSYLDKGMTIREIADWLDDPSAFDYIGTNYLRLCSELYRRELQRRNIAENVEIPIGKYTVGEDIPAGTYTVAHAQSNPIMYARVYIYNAEGKRVEYYSISSTEIIGKLTLEAGQIVEIDPQPVLFSQYRGLGY